MPPIELVTPPSLGNLSLEEENNKLEHDATSWEANVARNLETLPRSSSPYPKRTSTLEDLETDMDNNMVDITDFFKRPPNEKGLLDLNKLTQLKDTAPHLKIVLHMYKRIPQQQQYLPSPTEMKSGGSSHTREKYPKDGQHVLEDSYPG